jgi:magnesium transporter
MAERILYFTELVGLKVFDLKDRVLGRVRDAAIVPLIDPNRIDRLLVGGGGGGWAWLNVRYDQVSTISLEGIHLSDEVLTPFHADDGYLLRLERDLLDQQIIDAQGRKVVRVNDVTLDIDSVDGRDVLKMRDVDIGVRSVFRRLVQGVLPRDMIRRLQVHIASNSLPWELCNILEPDPQRRLRLNISTKPLEAMHPADLADIVEDLSPDDREAIFESMEPEAAAEALQEVDPEIQAQILESLEADRAADILQEMDADTAADVLAELEEETSEEILEEMESEPKAEVRELLEHDEDSAGGMMNPEFVALYEDSTVADAITAMRANEELVDSLNTLFLIDREGRLRGVVPVARVLLADPGALLNKIAAETLIQVRTTAKAAKVTELFDKYNLMTLPVTDEEGRLEGVVTADDIISVLRQK